MFTISYCDMQHTVLNIVNYYKLNVIETTKKEFKFRG